MTVKNNKIPSVQTKKCFIVAPIGSTDSDTRKRSDTIFEIILAPILKGLGYESVRADMINQPGMITSQIIDHLIKDELVIADLTGNNPNVLYELAVRHTVQKPVVQIMSSGEKLPFDIGQNRTIFFDYGDLKSVESLKESLKKQILSIEQNPEDIANPVSGYFALEQMKQSNNPATKITADVYQKLEKYTENFQFIQENLEKILANSFYTDKFKQTSVEARYIDGEKEAFAILTEVSKKAQNTIRSTRFFPESVLNKPDYVKAMEQRVHGTDGSPALKHYYRIVAINNPQKQRDINHHLNSFVGTPFNLYLTSHENTFELVIIDDTDAFIHFFKEENIIAATLQIRGRNVVSQFIEIFDRLKNRDLLVEFNCARIKQDKLAEKFSEVDKIFKARQAKNERS